MNNLSIDMHHLIMQQTLRTDNHSSKTLSSLYQVLGMWKKKNRQRENGV